MESCDSSAPLKEAKIGRILALLSIFFSVSLISLLALLIIATVTGTFAIPGLSLAGAGVVLLIKFAGLSISIGVLQGIRRHDYRTAGRSAFLACVLPPFDLLMLVTGLLLYPMEKLEEQ